MPEYLAPGVYIEETSFRSKSIEGVGTSTTAFAGPTRRGPVGGTPEILTSEADFERVYGGTADLAFASSRPNYIALAVRAYFQNGGSRLYIARTGTVGVAATVQLNANPRVAVTARAAGAAGNGAVLPLAPARRADALQNMYAVDVAAAATAFQVRDALLANNGAATLAGGTDGDEPTAQAYTDALETLERLSDISIVAAPGHTAYAVAGAIRVAVISHAEKRGLYRIAVLDSAEGDTPGDIRDTRGGIDSTKAAIYYPWVVIANPNARTGDARQPRELVVPPSGAVCGIYARNDIERGVSKTPANEVVRGALRFEQDVTFGENELLNPLGVNCLRYFPGRGYRVWGGRTVSSDPEWKYVSVRRYFNYLEASIERGTQWAVFESNGPALWANVRETISSFLYNEWRNGALLGETEKEAYFVRCDLSTMTQNDLDNGRLVCLIGVAVVKPAEFVIFRIGQKTATSRE